MPADDPQEELMDNFAIEANEADEQELEGFLNPEVGDDVDGAGDVDNFFDDLEDEIDELLAELETDPTKLSKATGESLWLGFDAEWTYDEGRRQNRILSIQLFVPP